MCSLLLKRTCVCHTFQYVSPGKNMASIFSWISKQFAFCNVVFYVSYTVTVEKVLIPITDVSVLTTLSINYTVQLSLWLDSQVFWDVMMLLYHQTIISQNFKGSMPSLYRSRKPTGVNDSSLLGWYRNRVTQHIKALQPSTTLATLQPLKQHHIQGDNNLQQHCCDNLKPHKSGSLVISYTFIFWCFLLTVHLSIILAINQLNAQILVL